MQGMVEITQEAKKLEEEQRKKEQELAEQQEQQRKEKLQEEKRKEEETKEELRLAEQREREQKEKLQEEQRNKEQKLADDLVKRQRQEKLEDDKITASETPTNSAATPPEPHQQEQEQEQGQEQKKTPTLIGFINQIFRPKVENQPKEDAQLNVSNTTTDQTELSQPMSAVESSSTSNPPTTEASQPAQPGVFTSIFEKLIKREKKEEQVVETGETEESETDKTIMSKKQFIDAATTQNQKTGSTPLHKAIMSDNYGLVQELARTDARFYHDKAGNFAIHLAANKSEKLLQMLMPLDKAFDLNQLNNPLTAETVLHAAVKGGNLESVCSLMGMKTNQINKQTNAVSSNKSTTPQPKMTVGLSTPLHYVFYQEKIDKKILETLLSASNPTANINLTNENGDTAAHLAVAHADIQNISFQLIERLLTSITPLLTNNQKQTILHLAAANKNMNSTYFKKILMALSPKNDGVNDEPNGEPNNIQDFKGNTPLHYAVESGNLDNIQTLLENQSSIDSLPNQNHETAFQVAVNLAVKENNIRLLGVFLQLHIPEEMLKWAVERCLLNNATKCLEFLVARGVNPNIAISLPFPNKTAPKPLFNFSSTQTVPTKNPDPRFSTKWLQEGDTVLHYAIRGDHNNLVKICLSSDNDEIKNSRNAKGHTPAFVALKSLNHQAAYLLTLKKANLKELGQGSPEQVLKQMASRGFESKAQLTQFFVQENYDLTSNQTVIKRKVSAEKYAVPTPKEEKEETATLQM